MTFLSNVKGRIVGMRFYRDATDGANHIGVLVKRGSAGNRDAQRSVAFKRNPSGVGLAGWNNAYFRPWLKIAANEYWDAIVIWSGADYFFTPGLLSGGGRVISGDLIVPTDGATDPFGIPFNNCAFAQPIALNPNTSLSGALVGVDVLFLPG